MDKKKLADEEEDGVAEEVDEDVDGDIEVDEFYDDSSDYDFVEPDLSEDPYFITPLDEIDAYIYFATFIEQLHSSNLPLSATITEGVNADKRSLIEGIMTTAGINKTKLVPK
ncbi:hypothetical protein HK101_009900 [Irineochytrium annulatum]|nr:hypothetical protein HK101_009900 [Irineochytrium annulatum]